MEDLKKKGHNININNIVIHRIKKVATERKANLIPATSVINIGDDEKKFIANLHSSYYKKSSPIYGVFGDENPSFKDNLNSYLKKESEFIDFSKKAATIYKTEIGKSAPASGGYLVFADYINTDSGINYLLILTTNNKDGFAINENLKIEGVKAIDMSKVDVACLINLTKFEKSKTETTNCDTYLSFVKGNKDVSVYFMTFIDCSDKTTSRVSSDRLLKTMDEYMTNKGWDYVTKRSKKNSIYIYCDKCMTNKEGIKLSIISDLINAENPTDFLTFAADEQRGVSAIISGQRSVLSRLKIIYYRDDSMTLGFDRDLMRDNKVKYDAKKKSLTFKDIPQELIDQIIK